MDESARALGQAQRQMLVLAARGDQYAGELTSAKSTISSTIAANEQTYALLGNPLLGALGPRLQQAFAGSIVSASNGHRRGVLRASIRLATLAASGSAGLASSSATAARSSPTVTTINLPLD